MPTKFLRNVSTENIARIESFNGSTGNGFIVVDPGDIAYIVKNIQEKSMKKQKFSLGYMGTMFRLKFFDEDGKKIDEFIVNYYDTIRKDPFFYRVGEGSLCVDYLKELENQLDK